MFRFILASTIFITQALVPTSAKPQRTVGPVVSAYLTNLAEELNELDFQLRHHEISRPNYERAYQRLTILRRMVERRAAESQEDRVPELEVLTAEEFDRLNLTTKPEAETWRAGMILDQRWKLISLERGAPRFFVFEKLIARSAPSDAALAPDKKTRATPNPQDAIETVIVYEEALPKAIPAPTPQLVPTPVAETPAPRPDPTLVKPPAPESSGPRIVSFYLPIYTPEARKHGVEGELIVGALFQHDGKLKDVVIERGLGYGLDQRGLDAVKKMVFEPARRNGKPIDLHAQIVFTFKQGRVTVQTRVGKQ